MQNIKNKNGITLIALIVTIIVLLILAGISITMLTGDNGILNQATKAKQETALAEEKERLQLAVNSALILGQGVLTEDNLKTEIKNTNGLNIDNLKVNNNTGDMYYIGTKTAYKLSTRGDLEIKKNDGKIYGISNNEYDLPVGYKQVEYLQNLNGASKYINTGVYPCAQSSIDIDFMIINDDSEFPYLFGSRVGEEYVTTRYGFGFWVNVSNNTGTIYYGLRQDFNNKISLAERYNLIMDNKKVSLNDNIVTDVSNNIDDTFLEKLKDIKTPIILFTTYDNANIRSDMYISSNIYHCNLKGLDSNGNIIEKNLIPCLDDKGKPCMYDTINKGTYYNEGTDNSNFTYGAIKSGLGTLNNNKYEVQVQLFYKDGTTENIKITIDSPLGSNDYIDFKTNKVYYNNSAEGIDLGIKKVELDNVVFMEAK